MTSDSSIVKLPKGWELRPLGDLLTVAQYGLSVRGNGQGSYPILRMTNQVTGRIVARGLQFADIDSADLAKFRLHSGDLLFNRTNSFDLVGRTAIFELTGDFVFASYLIRLRTSANQLNPHFLNFYLNADETQRQLKAIATRAVSQSNISATRLKTLEIPVPPLAEQRQIAVVLSAVQKAIDRQEQLIALTAELKKALMHKVFTEGTGSEPLKQTAIGPVPESWTLTTLGELCRKPNGRIQTGPFGSMLHKNEYEEMGTPIVNPAHLVNNRIDGSMVPRIGVPAAERLSRYRLKVNDLLFGRRGDIGRHAIVMEAEAGWFCGTGCFIVRLSDPRIDAQFLNELLSKEHITNWLQSHAAGVIMPNLSNKVLERLPICFPQREEQVAIAAALHSVDAKGKVYARTAATLKNLFRTLLHQLISAQIRVCDLGVSALDNPAAERAGVT